MKKTVYTLVSKNQFGCSEVEVMKNMMDGVRLLSVIDRRVEDGVSAHRLLDDLDVDLIV